MTAAPPERRGAGRIALIVLGSLGVLVALALLVAGGVLIWAHTTQRDGEGFYTTPTERFASDAYALTHGDIEIHDVSEAPRWVADALGTVRISASDPDAPVFVGIARSAAVRGYLAAVEHDEVIGVEFHPFRDELRRVRGGAPGGPPADQSFWAVSAFGAGTQTVRWKVEDGSWAAVVMRADGARGVTADIQLGAKSDWLPWIAFALLGVGFLSALIGGGMIAFGARGSDAEAGVAPDGTAASTSLERPVASSPYPVAVEGQLAESLSRWLPLVKWFLAIPHLIVLAFLWLVFTVLTLIAFVAILFTGRYPRGIFDFNVGVLRWTWRVGFYGLSVLGTDRYPPFSLGPEPDYPATLDIPHPGHLSRWRVLVKSWLLAFPQLLIVAVFTGGSTLGWGGSDIRGPGLIGILVVVVAVVLLVRRRYPRDIFDLLVGLNRWVLRVAAYVALMRDEYPPFRLGH